MSLASVSPSAAAMASVEVDDEVSPASVMFATPARAKVLADETVSADSVMLAAAASATAPTAAAVSPASVIEAVPLIPDADETGPTPPNALDPNGAAPKAPANMLVQLFNQPALQLDGFSASRRGIGDAKNDIQRAIGCKVDRLANDIGIAC